MIVSEFIEWLKTQNAVVEVLYHTDGRSGGSVAVTNFDPEKHVEYTNYERLEIAKGVYYDNTLFLGSIDN